MLFQRFALSALCLLALPAFLLAQGASEVARLRVLNGQAMSLLARYQAGGDAEKATARLEAPALFASRRVLFDALTEADPAAALRLAFPQNVLASIAEAFPNVSASVEARGRWEGSLELITQDGVGWTTTRDFFRLHAAGRTFDVVPTGRASRALKCNDRVAATGVAAGSRIVASEMTLTEAALAACSVSGAQNVAVIVVNMPGYPVTDPTDAELRGIFLGNAASGEALVPDRSVSDFWFKNSGGKTWVNNSGAGSLTVVPVTLPQNYAYCTCSGSSCSDNSGTLRRAVYAAADPYINYSEYSRVVMIFPNNGSCSGIAGVGTVGCWGGENPGDGQSTVSWTWWRADQARDRSYGVRLATHEMGHNLTLHHSTSRTHAGEVIGPIGVAGTTSEYGDPFGTMGYWNFGLYNAQHSVNQLAWMSAANYIDVTSSGTYSIPAFDTQGGAPKALRVRRGTSNNAWFWIAYYPAAGFYLEPLPDQVHTGAIIHAQDPATYYGKTDLVDFNPVTSGSFTDAALAVGRCWQDSYTDLAICATSVSGGMLNVTVSYATPPCTNANPTVSFNAADLALSTAAGAASQFRVNLTNNDSSSCSVRTFTMASSAPAGAGWTSSFSANPTLAPGASATVALSVTPSLAVAPGTYDVSASASAPFSSGSIGASTGVANPLAALTVAVPPPQPPAAPSSVSASVNLTGVGKSKTFQSYTVSWTDHSSEDSFELRRCFSSSKPAKTCVYDTWSASVPSNQASCASSEHPASGIYRFEVRSRAGTLTSAWVSSGNVTIP